MRCLRQAEGSRRPQALVDAANAGVAFPLSGTHYIETQAIKDPRQRSDIANVMASISHFRTIRRRRDLLRNQLLIAMHEQLSIVVDEIFAQAATVPVSATSGSVSAGLLSCSLPSMKAAPARTSGTSSGAVILCQRAWAASRSL